MRTLQVHLIHMSAIVISTREIKVEGLWALTVCSTGNNQFGL